MHTTCVNKTGRLWQSDDLCFQGNSKHHTTHTKLDRDPRTGFPLTPCLCRARADPACDSSRPCVTASVLLAFHNRPQLPELFPSPSHLTAMKERLLHTLKSHFRRSTRQNANSLGHINVLFLLCDLRNYELPQACLIGGILLVICETEIVLKG